MTDPVSTFSQRSGLVVFCQHGIADPLVGPLMLDYVLRLQRTAPTRDVLFFTEEPKDATVPTGIADVLAAARVQWLPLSYDVRGSQWWQRFRNLWRMLNTVRRFRRTHKNTWLLGYLSYGGSYAIIASMLGMGPCLVVCFEPHSRYMVELGIWGPRSMRKLVTGWLERVQMRCSAAIIVPTSAVRDLVAQQRKRAHVILQGITIDVDAARFDPAARTRIRDRFGWVDEAVLVYVGKFGGIYHTVDAYVRFMAAVAVADPLIRFLIITQEVSIELLRSHASFAALADRVVLQPPVPPADLHQFLSAADLGVVAVPPAPSQAFRTPVKSAHYWAAGLPLVIPQGVSDDALIAAADRVGIVVNDLPVNDTSGFVRDLRSLLAGDRQALRERCMAIAFKYRDTPNMVHEIKKIIS